MECLDLLEEPPSISYLRPWILRKLSLRSLINECKIKKLIDSVKTNMA